MPDANPIKQTPKETAAMLTGDELSHYKFIARTLVPDLHESGMHETAEDFTLLLFTIDRLCYNATLDRRFV